MLTGTARTKVGTKRHVRHIRRTSACRKSRRTYGWVQARVQARAGTCLQPCLENVKREWRYPADDTCRCTCEEWHPRAVRKSVTYYFVQNRV
jgi:hypothetical protein